MRHEAHPVAPNVTSVRPSRENRRR
jgi:hypothetical protein